LYVQSSLKGTVLRLLERHLPVITLFTSLPLFFSFQIKYPPKFLEGLPYAALWTWGTLATLALPVLVAFEFVMCAWLLWNRPAERATSWRHGSAFLAAIVAEVVFVLARRNP
jgi:hypothetical protein